MNHVSIDVFYVPQHYLHSLAAVSYVKRNFLICPDYETSPLPRKMLYDICLPKLLKFLQDTDIILEMLLIEKILTSSLRDGSKHLKPYL